MSSTNAGTSRPGAAEFALLAGLSLAWGTSYMFTRIAVKAVPPVTPIALRTIIGAVAVAAIASATAFSASLFVVALVRHLPPLLVATGALFFAALWTLPVAFFWMGRRQRYRAPR